MTTTKGYNNNNREGSNYVELSKIPEKIDAVSISNCAF